jgi:hypothetical protein
MQRFYIELLIKSHYVTFLFLLIGTFMLSNCKSQNQLKTTSLDSIANSQLGMSAIKEFNPSKTHVIYKETEDTISYQRPIKYIIFRISDNHKELEGRFSRGYIKWLDDRKIEIKNVPDNAKNNPDLSPYIRQVFID